MWKAFRKWAHEPWPVLPPTSHPQPKPPKRRRQRDWSAAGGYVAALVILYLFWTGNPLLAAVIMATAIVIALLAHMAEEIQHIQDRLDELENRK